MRRSVRDRVEDRMRDRRRDRDRRNPYGSRGGYVVSDRRRDYDYDMARGRDYNDYDRNRRRYDRDYAGDYSGDRGDYRYGDGHYDDYDYDMRDRRDYGDYGDYRRDYAEDPYSISKKDLNDWKRDLINSDGSKGEHFPDDKIVMVAKQMGVRFDDYTEKEFAMTANMLYSDYGKTLKSFVPIDKEVHLYAALAKDFLEDEDSALEGSEKLAVYYNCVVKDE